MAGNKRRMNFKKLEVLAQNQKCVFCKTSKINEVKLGPVYMYRNIITHYYCLLLSSNMQQNGEHDSDGILGFLPSDIRKEVKRGKRFLCTYCQKPGATLGCDLAKCEYIFHLPCGVKNNTLHQFFDTFKSYCHQHRPVQKIPKDLIQEALKEGVTKCIICYDAIDPNPVFDTLWAPCCKKNAWFHRDCLQELASSAGYFFKCPLCNNKDKFRSAMRNFGIYIPEQDASWESVPNAFEDLYHRHDSCDAKKCLCPQGRKDNISGTRWELVLCRLCGSQGMHIGCGKLAWVDPVWECNECKEMLLPGNRNLDSENDKKNEDSFRKEEKCATKHPSVSSDRWDDVSDEEEKPFTSKRKRASIRHGRSIQNLSLPSTSTTNITYVIPDSPEPEKIVLSMPIVIEDSDDDDLVIVEESPIITKEEVPIPSVPTNKKCLNDIELPVNIKMSNVIKKPKLDAEFYNNNFINFSAQCSPGLQGPVQPQNYNCLPSSSVSSQDYIIPSNIYGLETSQIRPDLPPSTSVYPQENLPLQQWSRCNNRWNPVPYPAMPSIQISINSGGDGAAVSQNMNQPENPSTSLQNQRTYRSYNRTGECVAQETPVQRHNRRENISHLSQQTQINHSSAECSMSYNSDIIIID